MIGIELAPRVLDEAHLAWAAAELDCAEALHAWFGSGARESGSRYLAYRAALDREEAAALELERLWADISADRLATLR